MRELLARYDVPGPRYTSYPTAVEFDPGVGEGQYRERLAMAGETPDAPFSLYVHLPFCARRCEFCGCHVIVSPRQERALPYLDLVRREAELVARHLPARRGLAQLHLGGGTPTYHAPAELAELVRHLCRLFPPVPGAEMAVEVDPRVTTPEHVAVLADLGFNRISLGVQDFTPAVQEAIGRIQSREQTAAVIQEARSRGYSGINVDLIYGLPHQTPETFERTVDAVIDMGADRAAVYSFAYIPWIRGNQRAIDRSALPDRETKLELLGLVRERFLQSGYEAIGMDHFARPDDELARARREHRLRRNFQGYTVIPAEDTLGLGVSAIGDVRGGYFQNAKKWSRYREALEQGRLPVERGLLRTPDDEVRRLVIAELMCNFRVEIPRVEAQAGIDFRRYFQEDLERLQAHVEGGLVRIEPDRIVATPVGEMFVRNLAMCFDRYWREKHEGQSRPVFSRTV